ncbi:hypothetical protein [Psychrobacter sp. CAL346-MNA-CIBAN-0220]|uniref:hypothetical protein n=1 Tax=Psychrobacter sp. CAL346-MNA-CIBAN-0220 TaxID=3140457 RepID=UPI00331F6691
MIDGIWWLVILLAVVAVLWLLAHLRGTKADNNAKTSGKQKPPNDALKKTATLVKKHFPDYRVICRANHLLITKLGKKVAMITIDKKIAAGQRHLGELPIINYHRTPSRAQLWEDLQAAE